MNLIRAVVIFTVLFSLAYCQETLEKAEGSILGLILKSRNGRNYYSYTGIPYAKPPIGERRFKAPEPVKPWSGLFNATKISKRCVQLDNTDGFEDCLYLNVYVPQTTKKLLPVMFWIHGGAFYMGSGNAGFYGPEYFMDKDVVLVTINYRLGILGFLSTEDDVIPGNYGLKDQLEALRWVKKNIAYFHGDPNQVTMFGQSAGAASIGFHMLSPMSKGLFHKAILESGVPLCKWAIPPKGIARRRAMAVATIAGCHVNTSENVLNCLRKMPAQTLMDIHLKLFAISKFPIALFNPVVENCNSNSKGFLCQHPIYHFKQESFVPTIIGMNSAEGGLLVSSLYNNAGLMYPEFDESFSYIMSLVAEYNYYTEPKYIDEVGARIRKKYLSHGGIEDLDVVEMFTDAAFGYCIMDMSVKLSSPVYSYIYDYQNAFSFNFLYGWNGKPLGVTHGDELNSLFKLNSANLKDLNENDKNVSKLMINIWYKFASSKELTIDGTKSGTAWPQFKSINSSVLKIDSIHPKIVKNPLAEMYKFWSELPIAINLKT